MNDSSKQQWIHAIARFAPALAVAFAMAAAPRALAEGDHEHDAQEQHKPAGQDHDDHEEPSNEVRIAPQAMTMFDIRVEPAARRVLTDLVTAPARVSFNAEQMAHVGSAVGGRVAEIKVRVGEAVRMGDVLLIVNSPELGEAQSDFLVKRSAIASSHTAVDAARSAAERARQLYDESKGIALTEVQRREAEFHAAQGELTGAQAAATAAENRLHLLGMDHPSVEALEKTGEIDPRYFVLAPIDGQVVEREATLGELVGPDREALLVLADLRTLWVLADVSETKLENIDNGSRARIEIATRNGGAIEGSVSHVSAALDPATRTARVRIEVKNDSGHLRPGMFAQVELTPASVNEQSALLAAPDQAVQMIEGSPVVFVPVPNEEGTFAARPVRIGQAIGGWVPILSGLEEGENLVVSGTFILKAELGKASAGHEH